MQRDEAFKLAKSRFSNLNLFRHVLAVEAVMRELAEHFGEDKEKWGLVGLLHDLDYEETMKIPERHSVITAEILQDYDVGDPPKVSIYNKPFGRDISMSDGLWPR